MWLDECKMTSYYQLDQFLTIRRYLKDTKTNLSTISFIIIAFNIVMIVLSTII